MEIIEINITTQEQNEFIDITGIINKEIARLSISKGICYLFVPHTTAALTINENADPTVQVDIMNHLNKLIPYKNNYLHAEGNSAAHIKASLFGSNNIVFIKDNKLLLGTWQGIFFCEFDGPRKRKLLVKAVQV